MRLILFDLVFGEWGQHNGWYGRAIYKRRKSKKLKYTEIGAIYIVKNTEYIDQRLNVICCTPDKDTQYLYQCFVNRFDSISYQYDELKNAEKDVDEFIMKLSKLKAFF
jgi:Holliday junction resolvase-like predicted endonuclease